jgi:hypothetical protein
MCKPVVVVAVLELAVLEGLRERVCRGPSDSDSESENISRVSPPPDSFTRARAKTKKALRFCWRWVCQC